jgi:DNA repair exonuclease SbcCD ATPase subunit
MTTLHRLHVTNLGPIKVGTLDDRAPVTLLLGPNEAGKTTLLEALSVLYFGSRGGVAVGENKKLTHDGTKGWSIDALVGDHNLSATRSDRPLQADCKAALGDTRVFKSLTHLGTFLKLSPSDRRGMLADLNAQDTDALLVRLNSEAAPAAVIQEVERGNMKRAHAAAVEARRTAGRMLKEAKTIAEQEPQDEEIPTKQGTLKISELPLATIEASLQRIRSRRDKVILARAQRSAAQAVLSAGEHARTELETLEAEASWTSGDDNRLLEIARLIGDNRAAASKATAEIAVASELAEGLKRLVKDGAGACPTCTRSFEEGEADECLKNVHLETAATMDRARRHQAKLAEEVKELAEERTILANRKAKAASDAAYRQRLRGAIEAAEAAEVPEEPDEDVDLDAELQRVGAMRDRRRDYEVAVRQRDAAKGKISALQGQVDKLEKIQALVDPTAMENEEAVLGQFNALLQRTSGKLGTIVTVSPGYEVSIDGRDAGLASDSSRIRAGFGIACAMSVIAGVGLAFLDRFESLDETNRKRALGMVKGLVDDGLLDTVLIAVVKEDPQRVGNVPWLASVKVQDGTTEYL